MDHIQRKGNVLWKGIIKRKGSYSKESYSKESYSKESYSKEKDRIQKKGIFRSNIGQEILKGKEY